jgi:type II secretion system protein L
MQRLFIYLMSPAQADAEEHWQIQSLRWVCLDADGGLHSQGQGDLAALAELVPEAVRGEPDAVVALIPAEHSLSMQVQVPGRSNAQIRKALPYVVEEYLASDLDSVHIASGPIRPRQPVNCHVLDHAMLADWLAALQSIALEPAHLLLDADLLPLSDADIALYVTEADVDAEDPRLQRVLVRTPAQSLATDQDNLLLTLTALIAQAG